jgi:hypothetical protein
MSRRGVLLALLLLVAVLALPCGNWIRAEVGRLSVERDYYRIKVVNEMGTWVRVGMIGYRDDANLRVNLREGTYWRGNLYGGQRVVVAWDREQNLILAAEVQINGSGTLRLRSALPMLAPSQEGPARSEGRTSPLPRMTLEPEGE